MNPRFIIVVVIGLVLACCGRQHDRRLDLAAALASESPLEALDSLEAIDPARLSEADRQYRDLLTIRARDKAYITHTSDSLILSVIAYYSKHRDDGDHYPMALYYGGRVYDDLGDYPTAMKYFQEAIDHLPADTPHQGLRCNALSQYGRLLNYLRLYDEAIPLVRSAIEIEEERQDTVNLIYDLQLLASICQKSGDSDLAEQSLRKALDLGKNQLSEYNAESLMALASIKSQTGQIDSALCLIRGALDGVDPTARCSALGEAAIIYYKAGVYDTAYAYCCEILEGDDESPKAVAYQLLLSPKMIDRLPKDSVSKHVWDYRKLLERFFDGNQTEYTINQQNRYNYQLHDRARAEAEHDNALLRFYIALALLAVALITIIALYFKNKNKASVLDLHKALAHIETLESRLNDQAPKTMAEMLTNDNEDELREALKTKLLRLSAEADVSAVVPKAILVSDAYGRVQDTIKRGNDIPDDDPLWDEIEETVLLVSPDFKDNLQLLTMGKLTTLELKTAYLIKLGIKTSQMTKLFGRTNGALISRRQILAQKVLDRKASTKVIDSIIRLL